MSRYSLSQGLEANGSHLPLWVRKSLRQSYLTTVKEPENGFIKSLDLVWLPRAELSRFMVEVETTRASDGPSIGIASYRQQLAGAAEQSVGNQTKPLVHGGRNH